MESHALAHQYQRFASLSREMASMDQDVGNMYAEEIQKILEGDKLYSTLHDRFKTISLDENLLRGIYASLTLYASLSKKKEVVGIDAENTHNIVNGGGVHQVYDTFESMGLDENLLKGIHALGYEKPSAIQRRGMVPFCRGLDVVGEAHPGSGKTATFCVGILQQLDYNLQECQALVLAPHGDLAKRIENDMNALAGDNAQVKVHACVTGTSIKEDIRILESGVVHVVVGTPASVSSLLCRGALRSDYIKMFVLDEADELFSDAFKDWIDDIFNLLPRKFQVGIFSNTVLPPQAIQMTRKFMKNPVCVFVKGDETSLEGIKQFLVSVDEEENKLAALCDLCDVYEGLALAQSVIFVNTREKVDWLAEKMRARDHAVSAIHDYMDDNSREIIMREFGSGSSRVLITTDLLDRGINVRQFCLVINYDLPRQPENYLLRLGRIGRLDWNRVAIFNFATPDNEKMVQNIQRFYNMAIEVSK